MDILYIIGKGSKWVNNELRFSLRGIAKNGINVDRVFIVGNIPSFVNKETVICIPAEDPTNNKHYNMLYKIGLAIDNTDIGKNNDGKFLVSSDDHFYIKPTDFNTYPVYYIGKDLPTEIPANNKEWYTCLVNTRKVLEEYNLPVKRFNWHGNTYFNAKLWNDPLFEEIKSKSINIPEGLEPTVIMLNYWLSKEPFECIIRKDLKVKSLKDLKKNLGDRECFSIHDSAVRNGVPQYLREQFPEKCKYEK